MCVLTDEIQKGRNRIDLSQYNWRKPYKKRRVSWYQRNHSSPLTEQKLANSSPKLREDIAGDNFVANAKALFVFAGQKLIIVSGVVSIAVFQENTVPRSFMDWYHDNVTANSIPIASRSRQG